MKKSIYLLITFLVTLIAPSTAFAASAYVVSGPSGIKSNGWYWAPPTLTVDSIPSCPNGKGVITLGNSSVEGRHYINVITYVGKNWVGQGVHISVGDKPLPGDTEVSGLAWTCLGSEFGPDTGSSPSTLWQGEIKWDSGSPNLTISSPVNNSNTDKNNVTVSGTVSDSVSGVLSVAVNGVNATLSGSSFSVDIPVNNGLNTLIAIATDYAGHTTEAQITVNRINSCGGPCSAPSANSGATQNQNAPVDTKQQASTIDNKKSNEEVVAENKKEDTPTLVKGVVQGGGIGIASILGFIIVLLILDKFRVIEIKAFSAITHRLSKPVVSKDNKKSKKK